MWGRMPGDEIHLREEHLIFFQAIIAVRSSRLFVTASAQQ